MSTQAYCTNTKCGWWESIRGKEVTPLNCPKCGSPVKETEDDPEHDVPTFNDENDEDSDDSF